MPTRIDYQLCNKNNGGTALIPCAIRMARAKSFLFVTPDWSFDIETDTFDGDYVREQIALGKFTPFLNTVSFTDNTPETTYKDYDDGARGVIRNGLPEYSFEFDNGAAWHAIVSGYSSFQAGGVIIVDKAGNIWLQKSMDGSKLFAFSVNYLNVPTERAATGDETTGTMLQFQIANEIAWNRNRTVITAEQAQININDEVRGILDVTFDPVSNSVANGFVVDIKAKGNTAYGIEALDATDLRLINNTTDAVINITSVTPVAGIAGRYSISPTPSATTVVRIETYDQGTGSMVAIVGDLLMYKGVSDPITITA